MYSIPQTTSGLTPQQRQRVDALLDELFDLAEETRIAALRARCTEDPAVVAEVESLLLAAHASEGFLSGAAQPSANDLVPDAAIGVRLGAWTIARLIGRGGMGEVYEAFRAEPGTPPKQRVARSNCCGTKPGRRWNDSKRSARFWPDWNTQG